MGGGGEGCELYINKDEFIFTSAGPLIWFFLNNDKLECDVLPHRKNKNGKECEESKCNVNIVIFVFTVMTL